MEEETNVTGSAHRTSGTLPLGFLLFTSILLIGILVSQDPSGGGPMLILVFLSVLFIWLLSVVWIFIHFLSTKVGGDKLSSVRRLYTSVAIATGLIFLVGLQTLRQLQVADIVLVLVFELLLNFYLLRRF